MAKDKIETVSGSGKKVEDKSDEQQVEKKDPVLLTLEDIREHCRLLERSVVSKESRFAVRVLRSLPATRKKLSSMVLRKIIAGFYTHSTQAKDVLMKYVHTKVNMVRQGLLFETEIKRKCIPQKSIIIYLHLLYMYIHLE